MSVSAAIANFDERVFEILGERREAANEEGEEGSAVKEELEEDAHEPSARRQRTDGSARSGRLALDIVDASCVYYLTAMIKDGFHTYVRKEVAEQAATSSFLAEVRDMASEFKKNASQLDSEAHDEAADFAQVFDASHASHFPPSRRFHPARGALWSKSAPSPIPHPPLPPSLPAPAAPEGTRQRPWVDGTGRVGGRRP